MNTQDQDIIILKNHVVRLSEHFDNVQVFATRSTPEGTVRCGWGTGDWYARYGHAKKWFLELEESFTNTESNEEEAVDIEKSGIVSNHVAQLSEHFDSIQIFCSKVEVDTTYWINHGTGNILSRYGLIDIWLRSEGSFSTED